MMYVYQFSGMQWGAHLLGSMLWVWWLLPEYESYCACGITDSPPPIQKQNTTFCSGVQTAAVFIYGRQIPRCIQAILMLTHCGGLALWVCVLLPHFCSCGNHLSFIHPHFCICQKIIFTSHHSSGLSLQAWFCFVFFHASAQPTALARGVLFWVLGPSPFFVNMISQEDLEGISSNLSQISTWTQG